MAAWREALRGAGSRYALALQTATRLRVAPLLGVAVPAQPDDDQRSASAAHLPGAGWVVGIAACLSFALVAVLLRGPSLGSAVAAIASTVVTLVLTGARNETAFFRWSGGLAGGDGTAGHGVMALVLLLMAKVALIAAIAGEAEPVVIAAIFAAHVVSRFAPLLAARRGASIPTATDTLIDPTPSAAALRVAALWCVIPLLLLAFAGRPVCLLWALAGAALATWIARRQGARDLRVLQQACEIGFYLGAAIGA